MASSDRECLGKVGPCRKVVILFDSAERIMRSTARGGPRELNQAAAKRWLEVLREVCSSCSLHPV